MGQTFSQMFGEAYPPKSKWYPEKDMPDLSGRVTIVTGGNSGIGKETTKHLLSHNAKVYMASRSKDKAEAAISELKAATGKEAIFLELDLASLDSVSASVKEFQRKESELHILFNSAGVMLPPTETTKEGYEIHFGTNVLGHAHFTLQLLPQLEAGAKSSPDGKARVINVSSAGAYVAEGISYAAYRKDSPDLQLRAKIKPMNRYAESKLGNSMWSNEFARRFADRGIVSVAVNPGHIDTDLYRSWGPIIHLIRARMFYDVYHGALTQLYAGTAPEAAGANGAWFVSWARVGKPAPLSKEPARGAELWNWIEKARKGH